MSVISNVKVYDLEESILRSGYPMRAKITDRSIDEKDIKRVMNLTKRSSSNGSHGQWLTGVRVNFDVTFSNKAWVEAERYRFLEFVSSQSTMHRLVKFDLDNSYNQYVDPRVIEIMKEKVRDYNTETDPEKKKEKYLSLLYTNPAGFTLTARLTTNYRCLLNIYEQRKDHRLPEWREFCNELLELPMFKELLDAYSN